MMLILRLRSVGERLYFVGRYFDDWVVEELLADRIKFEQWYTRQEGSE